MSIYSAIPDGYLAPVSKSMLAASPAFVTQIYNARNNVKLISAWNVPPDMFLDISTIQVI